MIQVIIENIFIMFVFISIGFSLRKKYVMDDHVTKGISKILLNVAIPAAIISSMLSTPFETYILINLGLMVGIMILSFTFFTFFGVFIAKVLKLEHSKVGIYACSIAFANSVFMGTPIVSSIWGDTGVFYIAIANIPFFTLLTLFTNMFIKGTDEQLVKKKFKLDSGIIASLIGLLLYIFQDLIPMIILDLIRPHSVDGIGGGVIGRILFQLGQLMTPISMFFIGSSLGKNKISDVSFDRNMYILIFIKLIFAPVLLFFVTRIFINDSTLLGVLVLKTAMPTAALVAIFAEKKNSDAIYSSQIIFVTTLFSLFTIPLITLLL